MNKFIAIFFSSFCVVLSVGMLLLAREDSTLAYGALAFFVTSISLLWIAHTIFERLQPAYKTFLFALSALFITCTIFPFFWLTEEISNKRDATSETNFKNTQVINVNDEPLFTENNNPIGVRLHYTVIVPQTGHYSPEPTISGGENRAEHFYSTLVNVSPSPRTTIPSAPLSGIYEAGVSYNIVADVVPNFLLVDRATKNLCVFFINTGEERVITNSNPQRLEIEINGTSFSRYYGQRIHYSNNNYNLKDYYETSIKEHLPQCNSPKP